MTAAVPPPSPAAASTAISVAAGPGPTHPCPRCGSALLRHGAFYWHATPRGRCPITAWSVSTIEAAAPAARLPSSGARPGLAGTAGPERPAHAPSLDSTPALPASVLPSLPMTLITPTTQGATMSKRGGNKPKRVAKPPMPNKGPKAK